MRDLFVRSIIASGDQTYLRRLGKKNEHNGSTNKDE